MLLHKQINGHQAYGIKNYKDLDELFGEQWHVRIVNVNGDFSCALLNTIQFIPCNQSRFSTSASLPANTKLTFVPYFTPQQPTVVFQFIKVDGGKCQLIDLLNEDPDGI